MYIHRNHYFLILVVCTLHPSVSNQSKMTYLNKCKRKDNAFSASLNDKAKGVQVQAIPIIWEDELIRSP